MSGDPLRPLRVAVVGCGYWGLNYVRILHELPETRVVAVCDQREGRLHEIRRRFPGVALETDVEDVLAFPDVEAAIVCTEARTHHLLASRCLAAGKHVLVEKPLTTSTVAAQALIDLAQRQGLTLMVGHTFLYNPGIRTLKGYLERGEIGRVYYLYARRTSLGPIRRDVNAVWDLAPHDISIFNYLLEAEPAWVSAVGRSVLDASREDVGFLALGYPDGVVGHVHVSWAEPNKVREVVVVGSEGRLTFDDLHALERVRFFEKGVRLGPREPETYGEASLLLRDGPIVSPLVEISEPLKNQCLHFAACVRTGHPPLTDGRFGASVVRVMEAIDRSLAQRGAPASVAAALTGEDGRVAARAIR